MRGIAGLGMVGLIGFLCWQLGGRLSADAIGMALGVLFGIMAGIPAALMVLAARRHDGCDFDAEARRRRYPTHAYGYPQVAPPPPVIVVTGQGMQTGQGGYPFQRPDEINGNSVDAQLALTGPVERHSARDFRMVGENDERLESW